MKAISRNYFFSHHVTPRLDRGVQKTTLKQSILDPAVKPRDDEDVFSPRDDRSVIFLISRGVLKFIIITILLYSTSFALNIPKQIKDPFNSQPQLTVTKINGKQLLNLNYHDTEIATIFTDIANQLNLNIIIDQTVKNKTTIKLTRVTLDQAINALIRHYHYSISKHNNILYISTANQQPAQQQTATILLHLHYINADHFAELINKHHLLSKQATLISNKQQNTLWIKDLTRNIHTVQQYLSASDHPQPQIQINAKLINIDHNYSQELGVRFINELGQYNVAVITANKMININAELTALEYRGHSKILAAPELITSNHQPAYIESGEEIPYQEKTGNGNTSVTFKKAVLSLQVTPTITDKHHVNLQLVVNQDKLSPLVIQGVPAILTRQVKTNVLVHDGDSIVLGGIYEQQDKRIRDGVPFLSHIPILGLLFQHNATQSEQRELLIFVTPHVINASK